jgi:hypothetical protein
MVAFDCSKGTIDYRLLGVDECSLWDGKSDCYKDRNAKPAEGVLVHCTCAKLQ